MKIYILVHVSYDYYEYKTVVDTDTDIRKLLKRIPDDVGEVFTAIEHSSDRNRREYIDHHVIETWEDGKQLMDPNPDYIQKMDKLT